MTKPLCICIIDAFGKRDNLQCLHCHPAPNLLPNEDMHPWSTSGFAEIDFNDEDVLELSDEGDVEAEIQAIFDEQEDCGQAGCGGGCSICDPVDE